MNKMYFVYILRNGSGMFYIGLTSNLMQRVWQHKNKVAEGFTQKYNITMLVYYEVYNDPNTAIVREKQLKNWNRKKKIELITRMNPTFEDLALAP